MIRPPRGVWSRIMRNAALATRKQPLRLTATTLVHCSQVKSPKLVLGTLPPALLNSTSSRPNLSLMAANRASTWAGWVTSVGTARVRPAAVPARLAVSASASARRPASTTE